MSHQVDEQGSFTYGDADLVAELEKRVEALQSRITKSGQPLPSRDVLVSQVFKSDREFFERWRRAGRAG